MEKIVLKIGDKIYLNNPTPTTKKGFVKVDVPFYGEDESVINVINKNGKRVKLSVDRFNFNSIKRK